MANTGRLPSLTNLRLFEELCEAALTILPCTVAWLFTLEDEVLVSRTITSSKGTAAAQVFLRLYTGNSPEHPRLPLDPTTNPISAAFDKGEQWINCDLVNLSAQPGGETLARALRQLYQSHIHFLPLKRENLMGILILTTDHPYPIHEKRAADILNAMIMQGVTRIEHDQLVRDFTRREEEMRAEQAFRKMVMDTMGDSMVIVDQNANIIYVNNRLLNISGYMRRELQGQSAGQIFHPEGRERLVENLKHGGRGTINFYQELVTKSGKVIPVQMSRTSTPLVGGAVGTILVLTDLTEAKAREHLLERQGERLRALNRAGQAFSAALSAEDVVKKLMQFAPEAVECSSIALLMPNKEQGETFEVVAAEGAQARAMLGMSIGTHEGIAGQVVRDRRSKQVSKIEAGETFVRPGNSILAVPLLSSDHVLGVLEVINKNEGAFTQDDIDTLENLVSAAAVALEKARLFDETQRRVSELSTLLEASAAVSSTLDIHSVLELISRDLREALKVARCSISAWDRERNSLSIIAEASNAVWAQGEGPDRPLASLLFGTGILRTGRSLVARARDASLNQRVRDYLTAMGMTSVLLSPIRFATNMIGIVELYKTNEVSPFYQNTLTSVEEVIKEWETERADPVSGITSDELTGLCVELTRASNSTWCVLSVWDGELRRARAIREIGFAVWDEGVGVSHHLQEFPTMARSLQHGMPMTLYLSLLREDGNERSLMARTGAYTGLITPLMARGESIGLVKLLDTSADRTFDLAEISLCQGIANVVANALENARLYQSLEKRAADLEAAYSELKEADELKDSLFQNISHEIKTPLHKMLMQIDLLTQDYLGPVTSEQRQGLQSLSGWGMELAKMVNDIVSLHSLSTQSLTFAPVQMEIVLRSIVERLRYRAALVKKNLIIDIQPGLPPVRGDMQALSDALDRLIDNAIKFSPQADRIEIGARLHDKETIMVFVHDYGIGVAPQDHERIFKRGFQVDKGINRRFAGMGVGLSLVKQTIEAHTGTIWVESTLGQGATFKFTLPKVGV